MTTGLDAVAACLEADQSHALVGHERGEDADGVGTSADAGQDRVRQATFGGHHLLAHFWALGRDFDRWSDCLERVDVSPLGVLGDAVDNAGTPVWVGNAGSTTGIRWHVGTSPSDPAPAGSDQSYNLSGCCAYNAAAARDSASGVVYAAFYSNSSATSPRRKTSCWMSHTAASSPWPKFTITKIGRAHV